ncbi:MAG: PspC domain-containing protein [Chloroflexi bacterium]|nr:PspC domain-containing protein [Chloroflexota bacterium]
MQRRLYRSEQDRLLTGLSGGMADYFDVDPTLMRLLWVLLAIFTGGVAVIIYFVMVVVVPTGAVPAPGIEPGPVGADDEPAAGNAPQQASETAAPGAAQTYRPYAPERQSDGRSSRLGGAAFVGLALVVIGVLALLDSLGLLAQFDSWRLWPVILIAFGAFLVIRRR